jgi:hypothetical protein
MIIAVVQIPMPQRPREAAIAAQTKSAPTFRALGAQGLLRKDFLNGEAGGGGAYTWSSREFGTFSLGSRLPTLDCNVAIRTIVIKNGEAIFNVGGGIVIDSVAENEYEETLVKATAIFNAINADVNDLPK